MWTRGAFCRIAHQRPRDGSDMCRSSRSFDARNAEPIIRVRSFFSRPDARVSAGGVYLPEASAFAPRIVVDGFEATQRYRLVFFGEKTSLDGVLGPFADDYDADLYLPSGELSDTQIHAMAKAGADDGREMVVFVFADCDPAGYQMACRSRTSSARSGNAYSLALNSVCSPRR